jgi:EAL domain-containing protein (putative c-di-GMP-specific phosphodiesterase class I)
MVEQADLKIIARYADVPLHVAGNEWGATFIEYFDRVLGDAFEKNPYFLDEMYVRYFDGAPIAVQALTAAEADAAAEANAASEANAAAETEDPDNGAEGGEAAPPASEEPSPGAVGGGEISEIVEETPLAKSVDENTILGDDANAASERKKTQIGFIVAVGLLGAIIAGNLLRKTVVSARAAGSASVLAAFGFAGWRQKADAKSPAAADAKAKAKTEAEAAAKAKAEARANAEAEARAETAARVNAEAEARAEAETATEVEADDAAAAAVDAATAAAAAAAAVAVDDAAAAKSDAESNAGLEAADSMLGRFIALADINIGAPEDFAAPEYTDEQIRGEIYLSGLTVSLQPRYSADRNIIVGAEVSISCRHPIRDKVYPEELVDSLIRKDKLYMLDRYIFESLCLGKPQDKEDPSEAFEIVVPVFTDSVVRPDFSRWYIDAAGAHNVPPECFRLDLIYRWHPDMDQHVLRSLGELARAGFRVALKDVGYANYPLALLSEVDIEAIVVAEQLIVDALSNDKKKRLLSALKSLCAQMGFRMEADRIDSREKLQIMTVVGCQVLQGNFLTRAIPYDQFWEFKQRLESRLVS